MPNDYKIVLCVNDNLRMGPGKIAAQCAHAAIGINSVSRKGANQRAFISWKREQRIIVVKLGDDNEMDEINAICNSQSIPTYIVHDAGYTEVKAGSRTVMAIGPAIDSVMDKITGYLKLF